MSAIWMVDATPSRQQLRELAGQGFPAAWIANRLGLGRKTVVDIRSGIRPMVLTYTARAINRLHTELQGADPTDHGVSRQAASNAQSLPLARGWAA